MTFLPSPSAALAWAIEQAGDLEARTRAAADLARPRTGRPDHPAEMRAIHAEHEAILTALTALAATPEPAGDPFLARLAGLDKALAYQAELNVAAGDPARAAACDNARLGLGIARDAYVIRPELDQ